MPANAVKTARDEQLWSRAKAQAAKQGHTKDYAYIMSVYQRMKGEKSMTALLAGDGLGKAIRVEEMEIRRKHEKAAKRHARLAEDHRRASPTGGGQMGRWRQQSAHEDAQEAHREAAEANKDAVTDSSAREEATDASDVANTHPGVEEAGKSMGLKFADLVKATQLGLFGGSGSGGSGSGGGGGKKGSGGWQAIPGGKKGGQRRRKGKGWEYRYDQPSGGGAGGGEAKAKKKPAWDPHDSGHWAKVEGGYDLKRKGGTAKLRQNGGEWTVEYMGQTVEMPRRGGSLDHADAAVKQIEAAKIAEDTAPSVDSGSVSQKHRDLADHYTSMAKRSSGFGDLKDVAARHGRASSHHAAGRTAAGKAEAALASRSARGYHSEMADFLSGAAVRHGKRAEELRDKRVSGQKLTAYESAAMDAHYKASTAHRAAYERHQDAPGNDLKRAKSAAKASMKADAAARLAHHAEEAGKHQSMANDHRRAMVHPVHKGQLTGEQHRDALLAHTSASDAHWRNYRNEVDITKTKDRKESGKALKASGKARKSSEAVGKKPKTKVKKSMDVIEEMDKLIKAANPGQIIGRTADGKEVYAHDKDTLQKQSAAPKKAAPAAESKPAPAEAKAPAKKKGEEEEEEDGPGSHGHHKDRALAHLQAAQAHASAAGSAKKVEEAKEAKEHKGFVKDADAASEAAMTPPKAAAQVQKSDRMIRKNNLQINLDSEQQYLDLLEKGGAIGGQSAGLREDARHRLLGMRGERLQKATIYQGEHDADGSRGGDVRETVARAQNLAETIELDEANNRGQGGLPEWFADAWGKLTPEAKVKARQGMRGPLATGWQKGIGADESINIIDDDDPYTRSLYKGQASEHQSSLRMAYQGKGRDQPK